MSTKGMDDRQLLAAIKQRASESDGDHVSDADRAKALRFYLGGRLGNEQEGRSQVVSRDSFEAIEGVKPDLLRIFTGGDAVVKFEPEGPEDIDAADQESEYINFLVMERNDGWMEIHDWIVDSLIMPNGYLLAYWDQRAQVVESWYRGLSDEELQLLASADDISVLEHEVSVDPMVGNVHDVKIREVVKSGGLRIKCLEPERVRIHKDHSGVSLADSPYVEYWEVQTLSDLRAAGFDIDDDIGVDDDDAEGAARVEQLREPNRSTLGVTRDDTIDPASREVIVRTCWLPIDYDGDGIAELRRVVRVGSTIILNELEERCTLACATTTRLPHRHRGISLVDQTEDVQTIKSTLVRSMLDNLYLSINGRTAINEDTVNVDDLMTSRVGGIVRVAGSPGTEIMPLQHPSTSREALTAIEYMDTVKESRTGVTRYNQGLDANSLNKTATGVSQILNQAQQKTELRARVLAETGFKDLFRAVHMLVQKNRDRADVFMLRNEYVPVDPREWKRRTNLRVTVGLGTGDSVTRMRNLQMITSAQQAVMGLGLASRENLHSGLEELTKAAGFKDAQKFWTDPRKSEPPPPQQDPKLIEAQGRLQIEQERLQIERERLHLDARNRESDRDVDIRKAAAQIDADERQAAMQARVSISTAALSHDARRGEIKRQAAADLGIVTDDQAELDAQHVEQMTLQTLAAQVEQLTIAMQHLARPRAVNHIRDQQGRIVRSEAVDG